MKKIWILTDDRAGNNTQVVGVAEALGFPYGEIKLEYNLLVKLPNFIRGASLVGIASGITPTPTLPPKGGGSYSGDYPDILISAGRRQAPVAKYIKKKSGGKTRLIHLMNPDCSFADFDLVILPEHDASNKIAGENIVYTIGSPNRITSEKLSKEAEKWADKFANLPSPRIGVLIGGDSKHGKFTSQDTDELVAKINKIAGDNSLLITTSRRTPEYLVGLLEGRTPTPTLPPKGGGSHGGDCLNSSTPTPTLPHKGGGSNSGFYFYKYQPDTENPYLGILGTADMLIVTGDSIAMCAEACATGKPVYIFTPSNAPKKHRKFIASLFKKGYARPLGEKLEYYQYEPLNEAKRIADIIRKKLN